MNGDCKYYWEDNCMKNLNEERIIINSTGECETFEEGVSEWYELEEQYKNEHKETLKREYDPCECCDNNQLDTCVYIENNDRKSCKIVKDYLNQEVSNE
jgi:hypothetical protein